MTARGLLFAALAIVVADASGAPLRVCADPNNLPFSNRAGQGFENRIAELLAEDMHRQLRYAWWPQRRAFARNTLKADRCDLWIGVAAGVQGLDTTAPYYRSSYVFVTRADRSLDIRSFDDPRLRELVVGVQMIGNDATNTPPAHALARRGITSNVRGYMVYGDYAAQNPEAPILRAVADREIDVAVVWGPLAGYFAQHSRTPLRLRAVEPPADGPLLPMTFDIAAGVRPGDVELKRDVERVLLQRRDAIAHILDTFGVPRVAAGTPALADSRRP
ncbi:MAG TPA: quinoprotein dehydrogenase-associated putative ABC transporter substrate-binding protein [Rudaea sp.]|nr:quinoprotein dehydrogenase-associated putative ABC transporter substrate-binding protein [Rudaea sp.]